jgi:hypothetical protein
VTTAVLTRTLDEELLALASGESHECLVCGEELEVAGEYVECGSCGSTILRRRDEGDAGEVVPLF